MKEAKPSAAARNRRVLQILTLNTAAVAFPALASATSTFTGGTSGTDTSWNTATDWSPSGTPGAGDAVNITSAGTQVFNVIYDYSGAAVSLNSLTIDHTSGTGVDSLTMSSNLALTSGIEAIGFSGSGSFTQSNGTNTLTSGSPIYLGDESGSTGSYTLSGTGTLTTPFQELVGYGGNGTFTQSGGNNTIGTAGALIVGNDGGVIGTYTLSGGILTQNGTNTNQVSGELIGGFGTGTFTQTGGTHNIGAGSQIALGILSGASGTYTLSNGTLNLASGANIFIGGGLATGSSFGPSSNPGGVGVLTVNGGQITGGGTLTLYNSSGNALNFSSGSITVAALNISGATNLFNWTGGSLTVLGNLTLDPLAPTTATLNLTTTQNLTVNGTETLGGTGSFNMTLSGTATNTSSELVLSSGTITQTGGTLSSGEFLNQGTFDYSAGAFNAPLFNNGNFNFNGQSFDATAGIQNDTSLTINTGQTVATGGGGLLNYGHVALNDGVISGLPVTNEAGGTMTASGTINPALTNDGLLTVNGDLILNASSSNFGTITGVGEISGNVNNLASGLIKATSTTAPLAINSLNTDIGTIEVQTNAVLNIASNWTNAGLVMLSSDSQLGGNITITNTGTIEGAGLVGSAINNTTGTIRASGGELDLAGQVTNGSAAQIQAPTGGTVLAIQGIATNSGTIDLSGGTYDNNSKTMTNAASGFIIGSGDLNTGGLTNNGTVFLFGNTVVTGSVNNTATLHLTGSGPNAFTGAVTNTGTLTVDPGAEGAVYGPYTGNGPIVNNGSLYLNATSVAGPITGGGTLTLGQVGVPTTLQLISDSLPSQQASLDINSGSTLDMTNNTLTINFAGGADPASTIRSELISGFNASGAKWTGSGITSSLAAANPTQFSIGYADGSNPKDHANTGIPAGNVEIMYTVAGDVNLSGAVDLSDLVIIASDFGMSGADWAEGDVNYDGNVDLSDLVIVASNFGASVSSISTAGFSGSFAAEWQLAQAEARDADAQLPEPAGLAAFAACCLLARRRRSRTEQI